jgi:hypothetical protein
MKHIYEFASRICDALFVYGDLLLYCKQGANRSAAAALAVIVFGAGEPAATVPYAYFVCICNTRTRMYV